MHIVVANGLVQIVLQEVCLASINKLKLELSPVSTKEVTHITNEELKIITNDT